MIKQYTIKEDFNKKIAKSIIDAWMIEGNKVFHLISNTPKDRIRDFYETC